jgi:hypothetical protein
LVIARPNAFNITFSLDILDLNETLKKRGDIMSSYILTNPDCLLMLRVEVVVRVVDGDERTLMKTRR